MRKENKQIDENFVTGTLYLEIFEQDIDSKEMECLVNDIHAIPWLKIETRWSIGPGLEWDNRHSTSYSTLEVLIKNRMMGLSVSYPYHILCNDIYIILEWGR